MLHQKDDMASVSKSSDNKSAKSSIEVSNSNKLPDKTSIRKEKTIRDEIDDSVEETEIANQSLPNYILHEVTHIRQRYFWDCGIACVLMLLPEDKRVYFLDNFEKICDEEGFGNSTWTIDLCYLLKRFEIKNRMYTKLIGVNEDYQNYSYYQRCINMDRVRVRQRFANAESDGVMITEGKLSSKSMLQHLAKHGPVILLVDSGLLVCDLCKHNKLKSEFRRCFGGQYAGHYILVVGYSARGTSEGKILYHDPALKPRLCATTANRLAQARFAPGTDSDTILIYDYKR